MGSLQTFRGAKAQHTHYDFDPVRCFMLDPREMPLSVVVSLGTARMRFWPLSHEDRDCVCSVDGQRCDEVDGFVEVGAGKGEAIVFLGRCPHGGAPSTVDSLPRVHTHLMTVQDKVAMPVNETYPC